MLRSRGGTSRTGSPLSRMSPSDGSSRPAIMRRIVDFPHPDGPSRTMNSPSWTSRLTLFTATVPSGQILVTSLSKTVDTVNLLRGKELCDPSPTTDGDPAYFDEGYRYAAFVGTSHLSTVINRLHLLRLV